MRILLTNDDGYAAQGIQLLAMKLSQSHEITICAPSFQQSGASHRLTLTKPLRVSELTGPYPGWAVAGTPVDCVKLALTSLCEERFDWVISGINHGSNSGVLAHYSGTVGAAKESVIQGVPAIAVSLCDWTDLHFETAVAVVDKILATVEPQAMPPMTMLNVNVPNLPYEQLGGIRLAPMGMSPMQDGYVSRTDPRGQDYYWLTPEIEFDESEQEDDHSVIDSGFAAVTPMTLNWTDYELMAALENLQGRLEPRKPE